MSRTEAQAELFTKPRKITAIKGDGYAGQLGLGPAGETCKTCTHKRRMTYSRIKVVHKCALCRNQFKQSTDIVLHAPACVFWQAGDPT